ncbi:MAG: PSD1 and planctomycete cytochrome C domain-containing protein [Candidatus Hydrogenedentes bacterium]|nr:PSD1 and planctomycete cytochrome C domain-containing protein [Candidatus Hydrogenedentota bacterium]
MECARLLRRRVATTGLLCCVFVLSASGDEPVAFNRDILPILSNNCFACHGPDAPARKADLRLDVEETAKRPLASGAPPVVAGDPDSSVVISRINSANPDEQMPPPDSGKSLTDRERELIRRWIAEGAKWQAHWSLIAPERPALPTVSDTAWTRNPIDHFILARLDAETLSPLPEADRYTLIRRVSLALTGLPPTPEEVVDFVNDSNPEAYEALVDRLLASPRYGEHMARYWLDLARYADTNGYAADIERTMWRYRDWVITAFNANMPFDRFTIEQLAGDLLPEPSLDQRIATGFNRNHPIMMEGGAIFEEYRVMNVVDRVDTTSTTWLGLTLKCAQCHDHKYDPISQREFYQLYAFFNNVSEEESVLFGTELDGNSVPRLKAPLPEQQAELARIDAALQEVRTQKLHPNDDVDASQQAWEASEREAIANRWTALDATIGKSERPEDPIMLTSTTIVRDVTAIRLELLPAADAPNDAFSIAELELHAAPIAEGAEETPIKFVEAMSLSGDIRSAYDGNAESVWRVDPAAEMRAVFAVASPFGFAEGTRVRVTLRGEGFSADRIRLSVSNDPTFRPATLNPWIINGPYLAKSGEEALTTEYVDPNQIDLAATYDDARAKWSYVPGGLADGTMHTLSGKTCATYFYRHISAPSPRNLDLALDNRNAVRLWVNGRLVLDKEAQRGEVGPHSAPVTIDLRAGDNNILVKTVDFYDFNAHTFYFLRKGEEIGPTPLAVETALFRDATLRSEVEAATLRAFYRSRNWDGWAPLHEQELNLAWTRAQLDKQIPTTMVMDETNTPRPAHVLVRGQYDQPGEAVSPAVPAALHRASGDAPSNRMGLAQWLVAEENPLTARVVMNRFWQRLWGEGLVRTPDDFGIQGERPTHPELLDWLAREFIESGWNVKSMQRLMVTSATFKQSSRMNSQSAARDPENRLLARGPRFRLDAELIRDAALAASGLLVEKLGGPSVKPYQPPGLWKDVAYGGGGQRYTAQEFIQDRDDKLYRRSLYTYLKRAAAPPGMLLFDAPNRDVCTARRSRSNTPLQALALMNDVQYVEAARAMAQRILKEAGPDDRIAYACLLVLSRPPSSEEQTALMQQFDDQLADFRAAPDAARELIRTGESKYDTGLDVAELAAWTMVANALLNTSAAVTQY